MGRMSEDWVAHRLALLLTDSRGVARGRRLVQDHAVRAALLVDFAFRGRFSYGTAENHLDTAPTGFPPADALLSHIATHPAQSMAGVISSAPVFVLDVLDPARLSGGRFARKRAVQLDPTVVAREREVVDAAAETGRVDSPVTAAVAVLAGALDLAAADRRNALLAWCGAPRGLVAHCAVYLDQLMLNMAAAQALRSGGESGGT
jgi:hypothetical protein